MTPETNPSALLDEAPRASTLDDALRALNELGPEGGLERFAASLDPEWIQEALSSTGTASIRRRKFPAEQALWLVLGMCLFADRSIINVVDHLGLVMRGVKKEHARMVTSHMLGCFRNSDKTRSEFMQHISQPQSSSIF